MVKEESISDEETLFKIYENGLKAIFNELPERLDEFMEMIKAPRVAEFRITIRVEAEAVPTYTVETTKVPRLSVA